MDIDEGQEYHPAEAGRRHPGEGRRRVPLWPLFAAGLCGVLAGVLLLYFVLIGQGVIPGPGGIAGEGGKEEPADLLPGDEEGAAAEVATAPGPDPSTGPMRSFNSNMIRWAPFCPMPGIVVSDLTSSPPIAARNASGLSTASMDWANLGPTPLAVCSNSKVCFSSSLAKPNRDMESSLTTREVTASGSADPRSCA